MKLAVFCMHRFFFSSILRIDNLISRMDKMVLMLQCCLSPQKGFSVCHPRCIEGEQIHALEKDGGVVSAAMCTCKICTRSSRHVLKLERDRYKNESLL